MGKTEEEGQGQMSPGRELDALIAEKVMSQVVHRNLKGGWSIGEPDYYDSAGELILYNSLPPYSTDIAAAWGVVEKLHEMRPGSHFQLLRTRNWSLGPGLKHEAYFGFYMGMGDHKEWGKAVADTAPHAICLAALKAADSGT